MAVSAAYANAMPGPTQALVPRDGTQARPGTPAARLWDQCCRFEGLFLGTLLKELRSTVNTSGGVLSPSAGRKMMDSMFDQALVDTIAERGDSGIAAALYRDFRRHDLVAQESDSPQTIAAMA